jgi:hypothetical protein
MAFYSLKMMAFGLSTFSYTTFPLPFSLVPSANENDECNWHRKVVLYLMAEWFSGRLGTPIQCTQDTLISKQDTGVATIRGYAYLMTISRLCIHGYMDEWKYI